MNHSPNSSSETVALRLIIKIDEISECSFSWYVSYSVQTFVCTERV